MTNMLKLHPSVIDREGEALWYALFALRGQIAKRHMMTTGKPLPIVESMAMAKRHSDVVRGFFCEMGRSMPSQAR